MALDSFVNASGARPTRCTSLADVFENSKGQHQPDGIDIPIEF